MQSESNDRKEREIKILFLDDHPGLREGIAQITGKKEKTILNKRTLVYQKMELSDRLSLIEAARTLGIVE